jgi:hypothetical protein
MLVVCLLEVAFHQREVLAQYRAVAVSRELAQVFACNGSTHR